MRFVPAVVSENWTLKLLALALAILLWTVVRVDAPTGQVISGVPVRVANTDPGWTATGEPLPASVNVRLFGSAREILQLAFDRPSVVIPVDSVTSPDTTVLIDPQWVRYGDYSNVRVQDVQPSSVRLHFEPITATMRPVRARLEDELPGNLARTGAVRLEPAYINVSGPESAVEALDSIPLVPLDLEEVESSEPRRVSIDTVGLGDVLVSPRAVRVTVPVGRRTERELGLLPVETEMSGALPEPDSATVTLTGPEERVGQVDPVTLRVRTVPGAVPDSLPGGELRLPLEVTGLPEFVEARIDPGSVTLRREGR